MHRFTNRAVCLFSIKNNDDHCSFSSKEIFTIVEKEVNKLVDKGVTMQSFPEEGKFIYPILLLLKEDNLNFNLPLLQTTI